ncbi:MAG: LUD domain-containing protein [Planctomycetota bacterium]|jgi:L-lactate dehydrogenase complex protein LldG
MSGDKQRIFEAIRRARTGIDESRACPEFDEAATAARPRGLETRSPEELASLLRGMGLKRGYCDPLLRDGVGALLERELEVEYEFDRGRIEDYEFGVTPASGAIEETGSVILTDRETSNRLAALAPWVHVACVPRDRVHRTLAAALAALGDDPNAVIVTGSSQTADVEGILIRGVHGPGEQVCVLVP